MLCFPVGDALVATLTCGRILSSFVNTNIVVGRGWSHYPVNYCHHHPGQWCCSLYYSQWCDSHSKHAVYMSLFQWTVNHDLQICFSIRACNSPALPITVEAHVSKDHDDKQISAPLFGDKEDPISFHDPKENHFLGGLGDKDKGRMKTQYVRVQLLGMNWLHLA